MKNMLFNMYRTAAVLAAGMMLASCSSSNSAQTARNEGEARPNRSEPAQVRTSSYTMPFEITYYRLSKPLNGSEVVCVTKALDLNDGKSQYRRSGDFVTDKFYTNFAQYSLRARQLQSTSNSPNVQQEASNSGCTLIAKPHVDSWTVELVTQRDMRVTLQMYDVNSLNLVNSFAINAGKEEDMVSGITYLIHKLYFPN